MVTDRRALLLWLLLLPIAVGGCGGSSSDSQTPSQPEQPNEPNGPQADLSATGLETPSRVRLDSLLELRIGVRNGGSQAAGPGWFIRVFLSRDSRIDQDDILIDQFVTTRELSPGGSDRYLRNMKLPGGIDPGTYRLGSMLDVTQVVPETDEDNNTLLNPPILEILPRTPPGPGEK